MEGSQVFSCQSIGLTQFARELWSEHWPDRCSAFLFSIVFVWRRRPHLSSSCQCQSIDLTQFSERARTVRERDREREIEREREREKERERVRERERKRERE
eukprot:sb/3478493/